MKTLNQFLNERFVNAHPNDGELKRKWADRVWDLLQRSYADIGGIKGGGFENKESMIAKIPMWKMAVKDGKLLAVILYKDKGGRKSVAMGAEGSDQAKAIVANMFKQEVKRAYGEKSKAALGAMMKSMPWDVIEPFLMTPDQVKRTSGDDVQPIAKMKTSDLPKDAQFTLNKYPMLKPYGYLRALGDEMIFKVSLGTTGKNIK
tara:strand:+ start:659 stop:1267 length:609 start_codon:yes stop_codon:yes gene_type:complete